MASSLTNRLSIIPEVLTTTASARLTASLAPFFPRDWLEASAPPHPPQFSLARPSSGAEYTLLAPETRSPANAADWSVPPSHHPLLFNPAFADTLPDGTDKSHWPGPPFFRRRWAGGRVEWRGLGRFLPGTVAGSPSTSGTGTGNVAGLPWTRPAVCLEKVIETSVQEHRVDVLIERTCGTLDQTTYPDADKDWAGLAARGIPSPLIEFVDTRKLVFLKESDENRRNRNRIIKATHKPTFSHTLVPTRTLLSRFSALTFNAHAIHLDAAQSRSEGEPDTVVHGPLSLTLALTMVEGLLRTTTSSTAGVEGGTGPTVEWSDQARIRSVEYRNISPLYVNQPLRLCVRPGAESWAFWIEGPDEGIKVRGRIEVTQN